MCFKRAVNVKERESEWEASAQITDPNISIVTEIICILIPFQPAPDP